MEVYGWSYPLYGVARFKLMLVPDPSRDEVGKNIPRYAVKNIQTGSETKNGIENLEELGSWSEGRTSL